MNAKTEKFTSYKLTLPSGRNMEIRPDLPTEKAPGMMLLGACYVESADELHLLGKMICDTADDMLGKTPAEKCVCLGGTLYDNRADSVNIN